MLSHPFRVSENTETTSIPSKLNIPRAGLLPQGQLACNNPWLCYWAFLPYKTGWSHLTPCWECLSQLPNQPWELPGRVPRPKLGQTLFWQFSSTDAGAWVLGSVLWPWLCTWCSNAGQWIRLGQIHFVTGAIQLWVLCTNVAGSCKQKTGCLFLSSL